MDFLNFLFLKRVKDLRLVLAEIDEKIEDHHRLMESCVTEDDYLLYADNLEELMQKREEIVADLRRSTFFGFYDW